MITKGICFDLLSNYPPNYFPKKMNEDQCGEFLCGF